MTADWNLVRDIPVTDPTSLHALGLSKPVRESIQTVPDALTALSAHKTLSAPLESMLAAFREEPGESMADLMNAITRAAHQGTLDSIKRWSAERKAGALLPILAKAARQRQPRTSF